MRFGILYENVWFCMRVGTLYLVYLVHKLSQIFGTNNGKSGHTELEGGIEDVFLILEFDLTDELNTQ